LKDLVGDRRMSGGIPVSAVGQKMTPMVESLVDLDWDDLRMTGKYGEALLSEGKVQDMLLRKPMLVHVEQTDRYDDVNAVCELSEQLVEVPLELDRRRTSVATCYPD